jgi:hypothetical protein
VGRSGERIAAVCRPIDAKEKVCHQAIRFNVSSKLWMKVRLSWSTRCLLFFRFQVRSVKGLTLFNLVDCVKGFRVSKRAECKKQEERRL